MSLRLALLTSIALGSLPAIAQPAATMTNRIGMEFVRINPGEMLVGKYEPMYPTPAGLRQGSAEITKARSGRGVLALTPEQYRVAAEKAAQETMPGFTVKIGKGYYLGKYEVTQAQWKAVMGRNPSAFQGSRVDDDSDKHPVDSVTWEDAQAFIKKLNEMENTKAYRLPTEFEWEYAARAGKTEDLTTAEAVEIGWFRGHAHKTTYAVGLKKPNAWGLYDMIGNVWEWVGDFDNLKFYADPVPPRTGKYHVLKGAGFTSHEKNATYFMHGGGPGTPFETGFRIVRD